MKGVKLLRITTVPISLSVLLKGQLRYMNEWFEVTGVSGNGKLLSDVAKREGIKVKPVQMSRRITLAQDITALFKMILLMIKEKPQIVHTHTPKAGLIGMLSAWVTGVPIRLHTVAGMPLMESKGVQKKILLFVEALTFKCATKVYPNSYGLKAFIISQNLTVKKKVKVLGNGSSNGIDVKHFQMTQEIMSKSQVLKDKYGIDRNDFVFVFVGRIVKDKGVNELVAAFDRLSDKDKRLKLLLVGSYEEDLDPIEEAAKQVILKNDSIVSLGYQEDVRLALAASHCLVLPSYREGFPNVVMQAGAMELPAIVSDINGCNEIVEDGVNGLIVPVKNEKDLYDAMETISSDLDICEQLSSNSRSIIVGRYEQKYLWNEIRLEYESLLAKRVERKC